MYSVSKLFYYTIMFTWQDDVIGACAAVRHCTEVEIQSMITSVKDLLPELGDGFIEVSVSHLDTKS